jgi:hypothetical protein
MRDNFDGAGHRGTPASHITAVFTDHAFERVKELFSS